MYIHIRGKYSIASTRLYNFWPRLSLQEKYVVLYCKYASVWWLDCEVTLAGAGTGAVSWLCTSTVAGQPRAHCFARGCAPQVHSEWGKALWGESTALSWCVEIGKATWSGPIERRKQR